MQKYVSVHGLSDITKLPSSWIKREADAGRIPCMRVGRSRMFDPELVHKALTARQLLDTVKKDEEGNG